MQCILKGSQLTLTGNIFTDNIAVEGGAIYAGQSKILMEGSNVFVNNSATFYFGGAISLENSIMHITDSNCQMIPGILNSYHLLSLEPGTIWFINNTANSDGGAISARRGSILLVSLNRTAMTFERNLARYAGGAIYILEAQVTVTATNLKFVSNTAAYQSGTGAALKIDSSNVNISAIAGHNITFISNTANGAGGAMDVGNSNLTLANCIFSENRATHGGAISCFNGPRAHDHSRIIMKGVMQFINNSAEYGGAWAGLESGGGTGTWIVEDDASYEVSSLSVNHTTSNTTNRKETIMFVRNSANEGGGAIYIDGPDVVFKANTHFGHNRARHGSGGAIMTSDLGGTLQFHGQFTSFVNNAGHRGGAIYLTASEVSLKNDVIFYSNTAYEGGAMYFSPLSSMSMEPYTTVKTFKNFAQSEGGVMYHKDDPTLTQCVEQKTLLEPSCFIQVKDPQSAKIISYKDTARNNGGFLFGGLLEKCKLGISGYSTTVAYNILHQSVFRVKSSSTPAISSDPYYLCFCNYGTNEYNCSVKETKFHLVRGQQFTISLIAFAQPGNTVINTPATIFTKVSSLANLDLAQSQQTLYPQCTNVSYNLYSLRNQETLADSLWGWAMSRFRNCSTENQHHILTMS